MKIVHIETLISRGKFPVSAEWKSIRRTVCNAVSSVDWPPGSGKFTIYPQSGKKSGEGNGVKPIKLECMRQLVESGWKTEQALEESDKPRPGGLDATLKSRSGFVAFEWETGNISSSHRALNKMALGLLNGQLVGGVLVVPSRNLYKWLTDRIGNYSELEPYIKLWNSIPCENGVLEIFVIEQDAESLDVPRIPKGTDGRAKF